MRVAVLDDYADTFRTLDCSRRLEDHAVVAFTDAVRGDALVERLDGFDAVVLLQQRTALPRDVAQRLTTVRLVSQTGRSTGHLDVAALAERGIVVSAGGAGGPGATAELTWGLILSAVRHLPDEVARLRSGRWQGSVGTGLEGRVLGVYGLGRIGSRVAAVGAAFGMTVLCWGREATAAAALEAGYAVAPGREDFFATADVLTLHLPLTEATRGLVGRADLDLMKPDALLVNTSRSGIVEQGALEAALRAGRPGRAAVDVFDDEPVLGAVDPLLGLAVVTATPHLGYVTAEVLERLWGAAVDQVLAFAGGHPVDVVTP
jgi:D-3-phosphoglycerate dehydrogenase / 2-oxoglutarate reductase